VGVSSDSVQIQVRWRSNHCTRLAGTLYVLIAKADVPPGAADELAEQLAVAAAELGVEVTLRRAESEIL